MPRGKAPQLLAHHSDIVLIGWVGEASVDQRGGLLTCLGVGCTLLQFDLRLNHLALHRRYRPLPLRQSLRSPCSFGLSWLVGDVSP
jgi:hypothetical protein